MSTQDSTLPYTALLPPPRNMIDSTENATPPKSRNSNSSVQKSQFEFISLDTEESEILNVMDFSENENLNLVDFGDVACSVETVILYHPDRAGLFSVEAMRKKHILQWQRKNETSRMRCNARIKLAAHT